MFTVNVVADLKASDCSPKTSSVFGTLDYHRIREGYESGLAGVFASSAFTGCPFRREILYRCDRQSGLLSFDLSCAYSKRKELSLFSERGRGRGSGLSPLPPLPTRKFARNSGVVRNFKHSFTCFAADR